MKEHVFINDQVDPYLQFREDLSCRKTRPSSQRGWPSQWEKVKSNSFSARGLAFTLPLSRQLLDSDHLLLFEVVAPLYLVQSHRPIVYSLDDSMSLDQSRSVPHTQTYVSPTPSNVWPQLQIEQQMFKNLEKKRKR